MSSSIFSSLLTDEYHQIVAILQMGCGFKKPGFIDYFTKKGICEIVRNIEINK